MALLTQKQIERLKAFQEDVSTWSAATFGTKKERGVLGPLKHLHEEIEEVGKEVHPFRKVEELADCLIIFADVLYRVSDDSEDLIFKQVGTFVTWCIQSPWMTASFEMLMAAAEAKMYKNKLRTWKKRTADTPVHHDQEANLIQIQWKQYGTNTWRPINENASTTMPCAPWGNHIELKDIYFLVFINNEQKHKAESFAEAHWVFVRHIYKETFEHEKAKRDAAINSNLQLSETQKAEN